MRGKAMEPRATLARCAIALTHHRPNVLEPISMRILLFGMIAERAGANEVQVDAATVAALREALIGRIPGLTGMRYAIAVDRRVVVGDQALTGAEEVAVLPPFAGG